MFKILLFETNDPTVMIRVRIVISDVLMPGKFLDLSRGAGLRGTEYGIYYITADTITIPDPPAEPAPPPPPVLGVPGEPEG